MIALNPEGCSCKRTVFLKTRRRSSPCVRGSRDMWMEITDVQTISPLIMSQEGERRGPVSLWWNLLSSICEDGRTCPTTVLDRSLSSVAPLKIDRGPLQHLITLFRQQVPLRGTVQCFKNCQNVKGKPCATASVCQSQSFCAFMSYFCYTLTSLPIST